MQWPLPYDPVSKQPSVTIMFPYLTFFMAIISVILLHIYPNLFLPTITTISFWALSTIFYLLRKLTKANLDWNNKTLELENSNEENEDEIGN